jgi:phosphoglycerate dehydrogenase-like enzyme
MSNTPNPPNLPKVIGVLVTQSFSPAAAAVLAEAADRAGRQVRCIRLPADPEARLDAVDIEQIEAAYFSADVLQGLARSFFSAVRKAPNLKWLHAFNAGVDHPIFAELLARGIRLTTSAGTTAVPIARSAITGLLMLARGFPHWQAAQRNKRWDPLLGSRLPADLDGQTLCIVGLGGIGSELARLALGLGMNVVGIRRSPRRGEDPVDELYPPHVLAEVLPRCQWLALTCPLTEETRGLIDREKLACLPRGAHVINVARGEVVDEAALTEALVSGHIAGAYLDVFAREPLPESSPLWDMPNVILSPHNAGAASGNEARILELFFGNFEKWLDGQPMTNEVANEVATAVKPQD